MPDISFFTKKKCYDNKPPSKIRNNITTMIFENGEDCLFRLNISRTDKCIGILNGMGENGQQFSRVATEFILESFRDEWDKLTSLCIENREEFNKLINNIFSMTEEYLDISLGDIGKGGTKVIILCIFRNNDKIYTISINIGDSPCVYIGNNGDIKHLWEDHSPDNIDEYKRYCNKVDKNKRGDFLYSCDNKRINIYDIVNKNVIVNKENYEELMNSGERIGGSRTIRRNIINENGKEVVHPNSIHKNHNCTVNGKVSNTRFLGNFKIKRYCNLDSEPSIFIQEVSNNDCLVLGTPHFYNLLRFESIRNIVALKIKNNEKSRNICESLFTNMIENAIEEGIKLRNNEYPEWGDITFSVVVIGSDLTETEYTESYLNNTININTIQKNKMKKINKNARARKRREARKRRKQRRKNRNPKNKI